MTIQQFSYLSDCAIRKSRVGSPRCNPDYCLDWHECRMRGD